eukprot:9492174-Pyramimonas_sp.AAC.1
MWSSARLPGELRYLDRALGRRRPRSLRGCGRGRGLGVCIKPCNGAGPRCRQRHWSIGWRPMWGHEPREGRVAMGMPWGRARRRRRRMGKRRGLTRGAVFSRGGPTTVCWDTPTNSLKETSGLPPFRCRCVC